MKKKLVQCSVTTQMERTPDGHKPASRLNTTRKINSNINYSHPAQPKRLALNIAHSQRSIPRRERCCSCSLTSEVCPAKCPCGAAKVLCERVSPPLGLPKPPGEIIHLTKRKRTTVTRWVTWEIFVAVWYGLKVFLSPLSMLCSIHTEVPSDVCHIIILLNYTQLQH